jgi:hypothetical protein
MPGLSRAEVRHQLGEPEDYSDGKRPSWKYGGLQIAFRHDSLEFIGLYFDQGAVTLPSALYEGRTIRLNPGMDDFEKSLVLNKIHFTVDQSVTFGDQRCLRVTQTQVGIWFVQGELQTIQLTR